MQDPRIYSFKTWRLFSLPLLLAPLPLLISLNLYGSTDPAAAKVGAILLPLTLLLLVGLVATALWSKPYLSVAEDGVIIKLPLKVRMYAWSDIADVNLDESSQPATIRIHLRTGTTEALPPGLADPLAAYAAIQRGQESAESLQQSWDRQAVPR